MTLCILLLHPAPEVESVHPSSRAWSYHPWNGQYVFLFLLPILVSSYPLSMPAQEFPICQTFRHNDKLFLGHGNRSIRRGSDGGTINWPSLMCVGFTVCIPYIRVAISLPPLNRHQLLVRSSSFGRSVHYYPTNSVSAYLSSAHNRTANGNIANVFLLMGSMESIV